jgi:hypothetical protein
VAVLYEITVLLLRTPIFPEIRTCETTDEQKRVIVSSFDNKTPVHIPFKNHTCSCYVILLALQLGEFSPFL